MSQTVMTRKQRRYARHREEILAAALDLFAQNGFHNVTMQQIAQAAEFSVGTLYSFFANKEDLYQALIREKADELHNEILGVFNQDADELTLLQQAHAKKFELFLNNSALIRLYLSETQAAGFSLRASLTQEIRAQYDQLLQIASRLFAQGMQKGIFANGDPYLYAVALDGMTNALVMAALEDPSRQPEAIQATYRRFFNGILLQKGGSHA